MTDLIKCPTCRDHFNPKYLDQVAAHMHEGIIIDQTIKGEKVMIKAEDLRRGNYVLIPKYEIYKPEETEIHKVESICEGGIKVKYTGFDGDDPWSIGPDVSQDEITGIPLTPEILEKCGFKKERGRESPSFLNEYLELRTLADGSYMIDVNGFTDQGINASVQYLHEFQNIYYYLIGEELTVSL